MYQIDVSTVSSTRPSSTALGTTGYFTDGNAATGLAATVVPAEFLNSVMLELMNTITGAGLSLSKSSFTQLLTAIQSIGQSEASNYAADTGSANAYAASYAPTVSAPADGMLRAFKVKTSNTGASTFALDGSSTTYPIYGLAGTALQGGELVAGGIATARYNSSLAGWVLISCSGAALQVGAATASGHALQAGKIGAAGGAQGTSPINTSGNIYGAVNPNLQFNGSGELGSVGWTLGNTFAAFIDTTGGIGTFFSNAGALASVGFQEFAPPINITTGRSVTWSARIANFATAGSVEGRLSAYTSAGVFISDVARVVIPSGAAMAPYTGTVAVPATTGYVRWNIWSGSGCTAPAFGVVWQAVKVEVGAVPTMNSPEASVAAALAGMATIGTVRNGVMSVTAASATATWSADEITVGTALGGQKFTLSAFSQSINLATTGAGGMDTGAAPVSGFVALYAIYNPATNTRALLATNAASAKQPEVYGGANMPSGYTASALVSVWPTNASSLLSVGSQADRQVDIVSVTVLNNTSLVSSYTALSISSAIPKNAKSIKGVVLCGGSTTVTGGQAVTYVASSSGGIGQIYAALGLWAGNQGNSVPFSTLQVITAQTIYYYNSIGSNGTPISAVNISGYSF